MFPRIGAPQNGWFIMENLIKMDDLRVPLFSETPIWKTQRVKKTHLVFFVHGSLESGKTRWMSNRLPGRGFPQFPVLGFCSYHSLKRVSLRNGVEKLHLQRSKDKVLQNFVNCRVEIPHDSNRLAFEQ